jgi:hypothetical protein
MGYLFGTLPLSNLELKLLIYLKKLTCAQLDLSFKIVAIYLGNVLIITALIVRITHYCSCFSYGEKVP